MKKIILYTIIAAALFTSCTTTVPVTSKIAFDSAVAGVQEDLSTKGYTPSGVQNSTQNNVYVSGVSYSRYNGYGTAMSNDYRHTDTYTFTNDSTGNTMNYSVQYGYKKTSDDRLYYVTDVRVVGCETSNPKEYTDVCGPNSKIVSLNDLQKDTKVEVYDAVGTTSLIIILSSLSAIVTYVALMSGTH